MQAQGRHEDAALAFRSAQILDPMAVSTRRRLLGTLEHMGLGAPRKAMVAGALLLVLAMAHGAGWTAGAWASVLPENFVVAGLALGGAGALAWGLWRYRKARRVLARCDGDLVAIYAQLQRDRAEGRL